MMRLLSTFLAALMIAAASPVLANNTVLRSDCAGQANAQLYYLDHAEDTTNAATYTNVTLDISDMPESPGRQIVVAVYCEQSGNPTYTGTADINGEATTEIAEVDHNGVYIGLFQAAIPTGSSVDVDFSTSSGDCLRIAMAAWGISNVVTTAENVETDTNGTTLTTASTFTTQPGAVYITAAAQGVPDNAPNLTGQASVLGKEVESNFTIMAAMVQDWDAASSSAVQVNSLDNTDGTVMIAAAWEPATPLFVCKQDPPDFDIVYGATVTSTSNATTYSFNLTTISFAESTPYRNTVVAVGGTDINSTASLSAVSLIDVFRGITLLNDVVDDAGPSTYSGIWQVDPTWAAPLDDLLRVTTSSGSWQNVSVSIYNVFNGSTISDVQAQCTDTGDNSGDVSCNATIPNGGGAICRYTMEDAAPRTFTWSGCTEDYDQVVEAGGDDYMATGCSTTTEEGSTNFAANASGDGDTTALQCQTFGVQFPLKEWEK